ncbi:hypothetical protein C5167_005473 [Papaver somniferum]|uniref:Leucine-rich repeat-containing N-terminal plant-type domain-containing protein n=1 Tax=Papaver somniferum TaxID=3469 RepID=A0A4Y7JEE1_PAPSO|nr:hypothetical protein C5167_005473 [Papaver somniferum]
MESQVQCGIMQQPSHHHIPLVLVALNLAENRLGSAQPDDLTFLNSLVNCTHLKFLIIDRNNFGGVLPNSIANLTNKFEQLFLGKNPIYGSLIPASLGYCKSLNSLALGNDRLSGGIPKQVLELGSLSRGLSLSDNLLTGSLPVEIGNLKNLEVLYLHNNKLSGEIPSTIGEEILVGANARLRPCQVSISVERKVEKLQCY